MQTIISPEKLDFHLQANGIQNLSQASIRQIVKVVRDIETETGISFVKMEMGVPGIKPSEIGVQAEIRALEQGVASQYPMIEGLPKLKQEIARFANLFLDIHVSTDSCIPTVGSMQGSFAAFLTAARSNTTKTKTLFLDPGFPVQKQQMQILGLAYESFDVYNYRGEKLRAKLESYCQSNTISTIVYSNPNNPSWICFTDDELKIIADIANTYDIIVIEDLAYFGMDFRQDYSKPGQAPFQPTIAKFTNNYILLLSSSKAFSYAGQRIAALIVSDKLYARSFPDLRRFFSSTEFGKALIYGAVYALSSGTSHSAQYALAAILEAANNGTYNFLHDVSIYAERAKRMKQMFEENGFFIVYDTDIDKPIADGFYFTIAYPQYDSGTLLYYLLQHGISAITLDITGSEKTNGLRACTSQMNDDMLAVLNERLELFHKNHNKH